MSRMMFIYNSLCYKNNSYPEFARLQPQWTPGCRPPGVGDSDLSAFPESNSETPALLFPSR